MSIETRARDLIVRYLEVAPEKVKPEALLFDDLNADSLDHIELIMAFQEEFGVEITDDAAEQVRTVGDAYKLIETKLAAVAS